MYDVKKLGDRLVAKSLVKAEEEAEIIVEEVFAWAIEEALASENKVDDIIAVILPAIKPFVMSQVDKIDGVEG